MTNTAEINNYFFLEVATTGSVLNDSVNSMSIDGCAISYSFGDHTPLTIHNKADDIFFVIGHPSFDNIINNEEFISKYSEGTKSESFLSKINGEFLIIEFNKIKQNVRVVNSRFASPIAFYYQSESRFVLSTSYFYILSFLIKNSLTKIKSEAMYELLRFRRLFNDHTYDTKSKYLPASSLLTWNKALSIKRYYSFTYDKNDYTLSDNADKLVALLKKSIEYKTSDQKRFGIMQSGGLDTRLLLANFDVPPHAYTVTYSQNREYEVAKKLVDFKGGGHTWLQVYNGQYKDNIEKSSRVIGGMHQADCMFYGHENKIRSYSDVIFAGYGMDYFFQGMYLPSRMYSILGEPIPWYKTLAKFNEDLPSYFIKNISYQTKGADIRSLMNTSQQNTMNEWIEYSINKLYKDSKKLSDNVYDVYEHMSLGDSSRHYTYGGQLAKMEIEEYRTIANTNEILSHYTSIPVDQRFDGRITREALKISDIRFYDLISANHGYPASYSSFQRSLAHIWKHFPERIGIKKKKREFERTWLEGDQIMKTELYERIISLKDSSVLHNLNIVDMDKLNIAINNWDKNKLKGGQTFMTLLTLDLFFSQILK